MVHGQQIDILCLFFIFDRHSKDLTCSVQIFRSDWIVFGDIK